MHESHRGRDDSPLASASIDSSVCGTEESTKAGQVQLFK